jgi:hypothetical protein
MMVDARVLVWDASIKAIILSDHILRTLVRTSKSELVCFHMSLSNEADF